MLRETATQATVGEGRSLENEKSPPLHEDATYDRARTPGPLRRWKTALHSFRVLRDLSPEQVRNFMNSYVIYNLDWADEKAMTDTLGPDYQKKVGECLSDYYSVLNHMCSIGELEKMYIPPVMDLQSSIIVNQERYEESIAKELHLPPKPRLLDLGCGRGRVAAHMTSLVGARVTGVNIDHDQIASARAYNDQMNFQNDFICMDFNDLPLPLPGGEFDGVYNIQAFSLCKDIPGMCRELYRLLKPGARLSFLDWVKLDAFDDYHPHHQDLMRRIKPLIGAVGTPTPESMAADIASAGFKVLSNGNASIDGLQAPLIERADWYFKVTRHLLYGLVRAGLLPAHFRTLLDRFAKDGAAFIEADRARLITTSYHWLAEKPREVHAVSGLPASTLDPDSVVVEAGSSSNSGKSTPSSGASSVLDIESPSPANSDSTGISVPPLSPEEPLKTEQPSSRAGAEMSS
ncbi:uncharacterized protein LTR77_006517 [Saxophila tyrrhenica]|uniref:Methyltransferase type 11 domain-containing protein n=1 Tax=Saxophila tyrrhenica TaxID=1690608 RepID=A0AAV9P803_9PEZI|nr:hypothetical protein LTR77_006517 [Saxophila tyrrhenica]